MIFTKKEILEQCGYIITYEYNAAKQTGTVSCKVNDTLCYISYKDGKLHHSLDEKSIDCPPEMAKVIANIWLKKICYVNQYKYHLVKFFAKDFDFDLKLEGTVKDIESNLWFIYECIDEENGINAQHIDLLRFSDMDKYIPLLLKEYLEYDNTQTTQEKNPGS